MKYEMIMKCVDLRDAMSISLLSKRRNVNKMRYLRDAMIMKLVIYEM
jgi:hypothetical protein